MKKLKPSKPSKKTEGFTLIEILIVIIILGVLASIATPTYVAQVERSRQVEALQMIAATRDSLQRYLAGKSDGTGYTGANLGTAQTGAGCNLDFCANTPPQGGANLFNYDFSVAPTNNTYTLRATRHGVPSPGTITVTQAGNLLKSAEYM